MKPPLRVSSLEELDPKIRELLADAYAEKDGGFELQLDGLPDVSGLNAALTKERKQVKQLADLAKRFDGIDPDKARDLLAKEEELEKALHSAKGKQDEQVLRMQREYESKLTPLTEQLKKLEQERDQARNEKKRFRIERELEDAARKLKVKPQFFEDVRLRADRFDALDDLGVVMVDRDGEPMRHPNDQSKYLTAEEWLKVTEKDKPDWFEGSSGGGATGAGHRPGRGMIPLEDKEAFSANLEAIAKGKLESRLGS